MATRTVVIHPGETIILPRDVSITELLLDGDISVESSCENLPEPSAYKCGYFAMVLDNDANSGSAEDESNTSYVSIKVGGTTYLMDTLIGTGTNPATATPVATLNLFITDHSLLEFMAVTQNNLSKRSDINLYFKAPEGVFDGIELKTVTHGLFQYYKPLESTCGEYPSP